MSIFQIVFRPHATDGRDQYSFGLVECEFETLADLLEALSAGEMICASALRTVWGDARGERKIIGRRPFAFAVGAVDRIDTPTWRIVEEIPEAADA